ncbi:MAG: DUF3833 domain-containing protein [Pseudomonadota bacterium]
MRAWLLMLSFLFLAGCSTMHIEDFRDTQPKFDLEQYFSGHTRAWGSFFDRGGHLKRQFTVDIHGYRQGDDFILDEAFVYNDGERQSRQWRIRSMGDGQYEGRAPDVLGVAKGVARGQALNWRYKLDLPYGDGSISVDFDDWMFLQTEEVLVNRADVSKFGFKVGEVVLFFQRQPDQPDAKP